MEPYLQSQESRRNFLVKGGLLLAAAGLLGAGCTPGAEQEGKLAAISPTEDLMAEHGVLSRLMLVYDEITRRLRFGEDFPLQVLAAGNDITRRFIQAYHEKNEESHLFNRFSNAGDLTELVAVLYQQHLAGRKLIGEIDRLNTEANMRNPAQRLRVAEYLITFNQLYRRHAAWEDTVLFPAFRSMIPGKDFAALGDAFSKEEEKLFGPGGFATIVGQVAELEKKLGIYELQQYPQKV
jgi:hemerythrin-like domain-containing protein